MKSGRGREGTAKEDDFLVDPETRSRSLRENNNERDTIDSIVGGGKGGERERGVRWETMDKVERKGEGGEGTGDVTALISSRWRRSGPGRKQKAIRHQTFKLENSPAGPFPGTDYPPPLFLPPRVKPWHPSFRGTARDSATVGRGAL